MITCKEAIAMTTNAAGVLKLSREKTAAAELPSILSQIDTRITEAATENKSVVSFTITNTLGYDYNLMLTGLIKVELLAAGYLIKYDSIGPLSTGLGTTFCITWGDSEELLDTGEGPGGWEE